MDKLSNNLPQVVSNLELANYSQKLKEITNLSETEAQILKVKYKSLPLGRLTLPELEMAANTLLLKIHVITGWTIPSDEIMLLFIDQFKKKAIESYKTVNTDEIEYAFRQYGVGVKDWGKSMNLSLIDEVMQPYLAMRSEVSRYEESKMANQNYLPPPKMTEAEMFEWINEVSEKFNKGEYHRNFLPLIMYDFLNDRKLITCDKKSVLDLAAKHRLSQLHNELMDMNSKRDAKEGIDFIVGGMEDKHHPEYHKVIVEAKKICLINYFQTLNTK